MSTSDPIVIIGSGRSGSTIFFEALSHHPHLAWISNYDSKFPRSRLVALHHYLRRSERLESLLTTKKPQNKARRSLADRLLVRPEEAYSKWDLLCDEDFSKDLLHGVSASKATRSRVIAFFNALVTRQQKTRPVIKITGPARIDFLSSIFPGAFFVHVLRDPRAVVSSILKTDYWQKSMTRPHWNNCLPSDWEATFASYDNNPVALIAMQYKSIMDSCDIERRRLNPDRYSSVSYSEFVHTPSTVLERVMKFADLAESRTVMDYVSQPGRYKDMDWKYKTELSGEDIAVIEKIIGM